MTSVAIDFRTSEQLEAEKAFLLESLGVSMEELTSRANSGIIGVHEFSVYEAISDIDYLLSA